MRIWKLLSCAALLLAPAIVDAAVVTRTYTTTSVFTAGPFASVTQTFTVTYDPTVTKSGIAVSGYTVDNASPVFNQPVLAERASFGTLILYAPVGGNGVVYGAPDFYTQFYIDANGLPAYVDNSGQSLPDTYVDTLYSLGTGEAGIYHSPYYTGLVTVAGFGAAPEPAEWAMMVMGFGLCGGMLRRGRRERQPAFA